jgi:hypothetical protein
LPVSSRRTFTSAFRASAHCMSAALRHPGCACSHSPLEDTGNPSRIPAPRKQRTNLPQALQSLDILITDFTIHAADHDGHDNAIKGRRARPPHYFLTDASGGVARAPRAGLGGKRSHGWRSAAGVQRAEARMAAASVRRWGMGNPDPRKTPMLQNMTG